MKKYSRQFLFMALMSLMLPACNKNLLDVQPTTSVTDAALWDSPDLIKAYVLSQYNGYLGWGWAFGRAGYGWTDIALAVVTDEAFDQWDYDSNSSINSQGLVSANSTGVFDGYYGDSEQQVWPNTYKFIRNANSILENLSINKVLDAKAKEAYTGEIKFLRAFRYFNLLKFYGGVPLIDKTFKLGEDYTVKRATAEETVAFILKDLNDADKVLPTTADQSLLGRATLPASLALRSRVLLYAASPLYTTTNSAAKWKLAADAAKKIVDGAAGFGLSFAPDYGAQFLSAVGNPEAIFASLNANPAPRCDFCGTPGNRFFYLEQAFAPVGSGQFGGGSGGFSPTQNIVDAFETSTGKLIADPTSGYDPQNPYKDRDARLNKTIVVNGSTYHGETAEFAEGGNLSFAANGQASPTRYALRKFLNEKIPVSGGDAQAGTQPYIHFRLSEIYLNLAEALNEAEGPASAYPYINAVRTRPAVGQPPLPSGLSKEQLRERIRNERRIELVFEDHRYFDVRRWKIAEQTDNLPARGVKITREAGDKLRYDYSVAVKNRSFNPKMYFLPIPLKDVQANQQLKQNPGY